MLEQSAYLQTVAVHDHVSFSFDTVTSGVEAALLNYLSINNFMKHIA